MAPRVVLIGAGHAHMEAVRQARRFERAGLSLTLISPGDFWYSGAATGMLSGALSTKAVHAAPETLEGPVAVIRAKAERIDRTARTVVLEDGRSVGFDVLSLNTGSAVAPSALTGSGAIPVKPIDNLAGVRARIEAAEGRLRLAVAGTGATGVETALAMAGLQRRLGAPVRVLLAGPDPALADWPAGGRRLAARALAEAGVERFSGIAERLQDGRLIGQGGARHEVDLSWRRRVFRRSCPAGWRPDRRVCRLARTSPGRAIPGSSPRAIARI